jgi:hypothetical protein
MKLLTVAAAALMVVLGSVSAVQAQDFVGYRAVWLDNEGSVDDGEVELLKTWGSAWGYVRAREGASAWLVGVSHNWSENVTFGVGAGREEGHNGLRWAGYLNASEGDWLARVFYEDGDSGDRHDAALVHSWGDLGLGVMSLTEAGAGIVGQMSLDKCNFYLGWTHKDDNWRNGVVGVRLGF